MSEIIKKFGVDFHSEGGALTLPLSAIDETERKFSGISKRRHDSGWTISGEVQEDYYRWVNSFEAYHQKYGKVYGDFEENVVAESEEAFAHFYKHHTPYSWDYADI